VLCEVEVKINEYDILNLAKVFNPELYKSDFQPTRIKGPLNNRAFSRTNRPCT
jgi:hypothetical protein